MAGMDQPGNAETGAGAEHDAAGRRLGRAAADLLHMLLAEGDDGQRLRLEVVEHDHVVEPEIGEHRPRPHHPWTIGQVDFVAVDRSGHRQHRRARLNRGPVEDRRLDRVVDGGEFGRLDDRKLLRLGIGVDQDREAGIGAADVADQDRKLQHRLIAVLVCTIAPPPDRIRPAPPVGFSANVLTRDRNSIV